MPCDRSMICEKCGLIYEEGVAFGIVKDCWHVWRPYEPDATEAEDTKPSC